MGFVDNFLKKLFGSKADRDMKEILPMVNEIEKIYEQLQRESNDQLRNRTHELKKLLQKEVETDYATIASIKAKIEETDIDQR